MADRLRPPGAGKSSFDLIDPGKVFGLLGLRRGIVMLDVGCGPGDYSLYASPLIGNEGIIYAVDMWEEGIARLRERIVREGFSNIRPLVADAAHVPLAEDSVNVVFMATVLHDLVEARAAEPVLAEARRVLREDGVLAVIEFEKVQGPPGPPISIRLSPEAVQDLVRPYGFWREHFAKVGSHNYMLVFSRDEGSSGGCDEDRCDR